MGRILIVEDDPSMARAVSAGLEARGYDVMVSSTGRGALKESSDYEPDVILLDLGLPDIDGVEVCRHLRRWTRNPVIVITADDSIGRKVSALEEGADDYLTKPFSMPELHARVLVAFRHRVQLGGVIDGQIMALGQLRLDIAGHVAEVDGRSLDLTRRQFALLALLARNCGKVLASEFILQQLWGPEWAQKHATLRSHVSGLRRKLGDGPTVPRIIAVAGTGYRMLPVD
jgi:two-component system KDP operon response regulator KdpE